MMVVITMSNCPPKLRGDLTRWLIEIDTCVFVGNLSARVRDAVWKRICDNIKTGRALMAYGTNNEQKLDFRIHNTGWEPVDYDGIKLVRRNIETNEGDDYKDRSKAVIQHIRRAREKYHVNKAVDEYVVIDVETTGLKENDSIIELAALKILRGNVKDSYSALIRCQKSIPEAITNLTGITNEMLDNEGIPLKEAMERFSLFCGEYVLVGHNIGFDMRFIRKSCIVSGIEPVKNRTEDTLRLARKKLRSIKSGTLTSIADSFGIEYGNTHRALDDCCLTYRIYEKLKEN